MDLNAISEHIEELLTRLEHVANPDTVQEARRFARVGELKLAIEYLYDVLHEDGIAVSDEDWQSLKELAVQLGVSEVYWQKL